MLQAKQALLLIAFGFGFISQDVFAWTWPWDKVDISKLQTKLSIKSIYSNPEDRWYSVELEMDVTNHTDVYIKSITADCSLYTQEGNRIIKGEYVFIGPPAIAPKGRGSLSRLIMTQLSVLEQTSSAQCEVSSAEGSK